jgi:hypothetical protein
MSLAPWICLSYFKLVSIFTWFRVWIFVDDSFGFFFVVEDIVDPVDGEPLALDERQSHELH